MERKKIRFLGLLLLAMSLMFVGQIAPTQAAGIDNNVEWGGLGHDSRDPLYRSPSGAVTTGTPIRLRLRAFDSDLTSASVRVWNDRINVSNVYPMTRVAGNVVFASDPNAYEFWEVTLPASALPTVYWYRFIANDGGSVAYYEDDSARTGGWGQAFAGSPDNSWQLSIYDPGFTTPSWVQNAVIYQIFPDRFRDGVPANNPSAGEFFYGNYDTIFRSNNTNWNTHICDPRSASGSSAVCSGAYSQNFYGGDLQGIIDELDYIQDLGVTAIYLNPIFEAPSNHKYDTTDFFVIDDNFGDLATFQTLVAQASARGINIILDGVFNHSSSDSVYFDRYSRWTGGSAPNVFPTSTVTGNNDGSGACETNAGSFTPWYTFFNYVGAPPAPCSNNRDYPKWFGIFDSLPVFQHDYGPVRDYFINNGVNSVGPYWISQGAAGWRLDVAPEVDHGTINDPSDDYWEDFRTAVRAINPNTYIVGEEWGNPTSWNLGGEWDATMNYQFGAAVLSFLRDSSFNDNDFNGGSSAGVLNPIDATALNERLLNLEERYAPPAFYAMMNLFGSHDTNRALFLLDHNTGSNNTAQYNNPNYDWSDAISRLRGAALIQMTMPGAPTIYYGDEIGLVGPVAFDGSQWQDDPYNRQPYPWLDETGTPYYAHLNDVTARNNLFNYYALLTSTRNNNPALRTGSLDPLLMAGDIYAYGRQMPDDSNTAVVIVNSGASAQPATVNVSGYLPVGAILTDALTSTPYAVDASGNIIVGSVPARGGLILILNSFTDRPSCITDLVAVSGAGTVDLSWSNATNAATYDVYRSRLSGGGYELLMSVGTNSHSDTTALNATTYYYLVVGKNSNLLTSDFFCNNEVVATPALAIDWHALQWPPTMTHTVSAVTPTSTVYGRVYINGVSGGQNAIDPTPGLLAEVGYGAENTTPDATWTWFPATFNNNQGNDDEFMGTMIVTATPGTYWYTYRWSTDGGVTWRYSQFNPPGGDYTSGNVGVMTLNAPTDVTAPATPTNLAILATSTSSITLGWDAHPNTDGDLYGFRVYRENTASPGYTLIQTVVGAGAVQYIDTTVTSGEEYNYYITAIDTSTNASGQSNVVTATAEARMVAVTFTVTVPNPSPGTVHIVGSFNGWNPGDPAYAMTQVNATTWTITFDILDETTVEYKYARSDWLMGEKQADGNAEIPNRMLTAAYGVTGTQARNDTVANWRDPLVVSTNPANGATGVPPGATLDIVWNQDMPTNVAGVTVTGPSGVVTGTWAFDTASNTSTFTPSAALEVGAHSVAVIGSVDVAGDVQQVPYNYTFDVGLPTGMVAVTFSATVPSHTPTDVYLVGGFGSAGYPEWTPNGILMTEVSPDVWEVTLILPDAGYFEYKYARNDWSNEERDADGYSGGGNRNITVADGGGQVQTVTNTVGNWRDPYVISVTPANASINNAPNSVVVITWNKNMPALGGTFTLSDSVPSNVAGIITTGTNSHTFTPDATLPDGAYSVAVSGNTDWNGNNQQVPFASTFNVSAIAGVDVTFSVTVPSHTPGTVYLVGDFGQIGQPDWVANGIAMTPVGGDVWQVTFNAVPVGTTFTYKYTRGSFDSVEKEADGNAEILGGANRSYTVTGTPSIADTVANWRDPYVISSVPADGASLTDGNTTISFTWNQDMPASLGGTFTVLDSASNPVAGTLTYDSPTDTHTFTPTTLPLANEVYTIALSGNTDVNGDVQQFADGFSFTVTSALYDLGDAGTTWYTLQWPPTITHTLSAIIPTANIYGQIWINGVTDPAGQAAGVIAEVGYGPDGTLPTDPAWVWVATTFNANVGNNDEYMGTLLPTSAGNFDYLYRYSADGGTTWYYGATTGPYRTLGAYNPADAGQLTVSASPDTTAPTAPTNVVVVSATDTQIQIGWDAHPNTDGDLYAFEVYRDGVLIDTILDPLAVTYTDSTVVTGTTYAYYIVAVDTSFNPSAPSNTVNATATTVVVVVTPVVTPPVDPGNPNPNPPANPPANPPGLIIRFENNNNFVGRGASRVLQLLFENISGQPLNGTLELVFPRGITPSNANSPHGAPSIVQLIDEVFSFAKRMINTEQQNTPTQTVVRLNFGQIANGETVTLNVMATVDAQFTQPSAMIEGRLIVNGAVVDTATAMLVIDSNILALPATGETPLWRDALLASLIGLAGLGVMFTIWRKRATA